MVTLLETRLDIYLTEKGLALSRSQAKDLIKRSQVEVNGKPAKKAGQLVSETDEVKVLEKIQYVGRGAHKLLAALDTFEINPEGMIAADLGASTGGFTQVLLLKNIKKVYCVDVGTNQLHELVKWDERVVNLQQTHVDKAPDLIKEKIDIVVCDLSFISLSSVMNSISKLFTEKTVGVFLLKPQFELGKEFVGKNGLVKLSDAPMALEKLKESLSQVSLQLDNSIPSPVKGKEGNLEYLVFVKR